jgi:general secretion pathway protein H
MQVDIAPSPRHKAGFTFIEVMLVVLVVGILAAGISANLISSRPGDAVKTEGLRFAAIINLAAEYSLMNNVELGVHLDENSYQIVGYDGIRWSPLANEAIFERYQLKNEVEFSLLLDDLPLGEGELIDSVDFSTYGQDQQDLQESSGTNKKDQPIVPVIFIFSGGEITPFTMEFSLGRLADEQVIFNVIGHYSTPVTTEGPLTSDDY